VAAHVVDNSQAFGPADLGRVLRPFTWQRQLQPTPPFVAAMSALKWVEEAAGDSLEISAVMATLRYIRARTHHAWRSPAAVWPALLPKSVDGLQSNFLPALEELLNKQGESDLAQTLTGQVGRSEGDFRPMGSCIEKPRRRRQRYRSFRPVRFDVGRS